MKDITFDAALAVVAFVGSLCMAWGGEVLGATALVLLSVILLLNVRLTLLTRSIEARLDRIEDPKGKTCPK